MLANSLAVGIAEAAAFCNGTQSGTTASFNIAGTTCTVPFIPGSTGVTITNNPPTPGAAGTLLQDASTFTYANGATTVTTPPGTLTDGTGPTSAIFNFPGYTLVSNVAASNTGPTTISGGTLQVGAANLFSAASPLTVASGGTADFGGYSQTFNNVVSLAGGTIQNGTLVGSVISSGGTLNNVTLAGSSTLTTTAGTTLIPNGYGFNTLVIGGGSVLTISQGLQGNGGLFTGTGTLNGSVNSTGITIAPGSGATPGVLTINGAVNLGQGTTLQIAATPTQASQLTVNGATTIRGATVAVNAQNATYQPNSTYRILSSTGGVSGTFSGATANYAYLNPTLSYDNNDAYLTLASNGNSLQSVMNSPNTAAVAAAINSAPQSQLYRAFQGLTPAQAQAAANSLSGEGNTQAQTSGSIATRTFTNFISDRASPGGAGGQAAVEVSVTGTAPAGVRSYAAFQADASPIVVDRPKPPPGLRVFATGFGGATNLQGQNAGVAGQNASFYGGLIGIDYKLTPDLLIGLALGGSNTDFAVPTRGSSGSVTGFNGNLFSIATFGLFYAQTLTTISDFNNTTTRNIAGFGGLPSAVEKASFNSFEIRERLEAGRVVDLSKQTNVRGFKVTPFVAMEIAELTTSGFSENNVGGGPNIFGLASDGHTFDDARTFIGARLETSAALGNGMTLRPIVRLSYVHSFTTAPAAMSSFESIPGATFAVAGANVAHNAAEVKAGAELELTKNAVAFGNFESELASTEQIYGGRAGIRVNF